METTGTSTIASKTLVVPGARRDTMSMLAFARHGNRRGRAVVDQRQCRGVIPADHHGYPWFPDDVFCSPRPDSLRTVW